MKTENRKQPDENQDQPRVAVVSIAPSLHARDMTRQFVSEDALSLGGSQPAQRALARKLGIIPLHPAQPCQRWPEARVCRSIRQAEGRTNSSSQRIFGKGSP